MQYYFGNQMPLRILEEADFWKQQEQEHTIVIRKLLQDLEEMYVNVLTEWEGCIFKNTSTSNAGYRVSKSLT